MDLLDRFKAFRKEFHRAKANKAVFDSIVPLDDRPLTYGIARTGEAVAEKDVLARIDAGEVIVVRDLLSRLGLDGHVDRLSQAYFGVPASGLAKLHELKSVEEVVESAGTSRRSDLSLMIQSSIITRIMKPHSETFYIELDPNIRPHLPFRYVADHEDYIESRLGRGKMNPHGQHKDSWRFHPPRTINIWVALTDAGGGNGMSILPRSQDYFPKYGSKEIHPSSKTYISMQYVTDLKAGDAVIFLADLLHGSILNNIDDTRVAFSMRCSIDQPHFHREHVYNYIGYDRGKFKSLAMAKAFGRNDWVPPSRDVASDMFDAIAPKMDIVEKTGSKLAVRVGDTVKTFPRRCPHKGADLAMGGLDKDGNLLCPWHRMCITAQKVSDLEKA